MSNKISLIKKGNNKHVLFLDHLILYFSYNDLIALESKKIGKFKTNLKFSKTMIRHLDEFNLNDFKEIDQIELENLVGVL